MNNHPTLNIRGNKLRTFSLGYIKHRASLRQSGTLKGRGAQHGVNIVATATEAEDTTLGAVDLGTPDNNTAGKVQAVGESIFQYLASVVCKHRAKTPGTAGITPEAGTNPQPEILTSATEDRS
jgi:hypothetical protein